MNSVVLITAVSLVLNVVLVVMNRRDRREDQRRTFAEVVVRERLKIAADLLSAFVVRVGQIHDLALYTEHIATPQHPNRDFALRSLEKLNYERQPVGVERLNATIAAAQVAFSNEALGPALQLMGFLQAAIDKGPPFDASEASDQLQATADALRREIRVDEAVEYQGRLFGERATAGPRTPTRTR